MKIKIYNFRGDIVCTKIILIFDIREIRYDLIHKVVMLNYSCNRITLANTKQLSFVVGSTKKIYRQKGTGRSRHGSVRRSLFRGGCVTFGPTNKKSYFLKINKKLKKIALLHSIVLKNYTNNIIVYDRLCSISNKTKSVIKLYGCFLYKKILFVDIVWSRFYIEMHVFI